eukprot:3807356-Amphidinium_carterae.1
MRWAKSEEDVVANDVAVRCLRAKSRMFRASRFQLPECMRFKYQGSETKISGSTLSLSCSILKRPLGVHSHPVNLMGSHT